MEECRDTVEETDQQSIKSSNDIHLIPTQKTRQRVRSENDHVPAFNQICDGGSVYTTPSMLSLISIPITLDDNTRTNIVGPLFLCSATVKYSNFFTTHYSIQLMWYQKKRELMELFLQKHTLCFSKKE